MLPEKGIIVSVELLFKLVLGTVVSYIMFRFREDRKELKELKDKVEDSMNREDVRELIEDKLAPMSVKIDSIDDKIDRLLDRDS
jgi:hypothetical protein